MKKLMLLTSTLVAGVAFASSVSSTQTFGVLKVASTNEQTVVSVPWVSAGDINTAVAVTNFVKTTGMTSGDKLYLYNTTGDDKGKFSVWVLSNGAWVAPAGEVSSFGNFNTVKDAGATIAQGSALVVVRSNPTADDIYLYGQYKSSYTPAAIGHSASATETTLFAPVNVDGVDLHLNDQGDGTSKYLKWTNAVVGDKIRIQDDFGDVATYTYTSGGTWSYLNSDVAGTAGWLKPGHGAWYVAKKGARGGAPTYSIETSSNAE